MQYKNVGAFSRGDSSPIKDTEKPRATPYSSEFGLNKKERRSLFIKNVAITDAPINVTLPEHVGLLIQNTGANDVLYSPSNTTEFQLLIAAGGAGFVLDNHEQTNMYFKCATGLASSLRLQSW